MKYEQLNKVLNTNKSEEKLFIKKNIENVNSRNIFTEYGENTVNTYDNFAPDNIAKSCVIPKTQKNKNSTKNLDNFASISPINKNFYDVIPAKKNVNSENYNKYQLIDSNIDNQKRKSNINILNSNEILNTKPILIIDVKLKEGIMKHIKVYEGDTSDKLSNEFADANSKISFSNKQLYLIE